MADASTLPTILIVDDAPANIKVLREALRDEHRVRFATTGEEALAIAASDAPPDLVLLDVMLPGLDGYEVCRRLKADPATAAIPVIFITARAHEEDETRGLQLGAVDYIAKPFSLPIVRARVRTHLELRRKAELEAQKQSLEAKNEALRKLDRLKDEFLANTSHELRTPLSGIIGLADSMLHGAVGTLPDPASHNLAMLVASGQRLANLVDDLLDYSKLRTRNLELECRPVDLRALADVVIQLSRPLLRGKPVRLENRIDAAAPAVHADEARLQQILFNLVGNAVKFTAAGSIALSAADAGGGLVEVRVADTGIGIPREKHEAIFESFEQVDASITRLYGGTGLGLSITRRLVELHAGTIRVESEPGRGSTFVFTLPRSSEPVTEMPAKTARVRAVPAEPAASAPVAARHAGESHGRILVVDDETVNQQVLANYLSADGYAIMPAYGGEEALGILSAEASIDLVLLDVMMPRLSGFEVCRAIRERHLPNELPVLMLSAKNQVSDLTEGLEAGANDYLTKPFSRDELLARVRTHLNLLKIHDAYGRFVPEEFLKTLGRRSIIDVRLGDHIQSEMTVLFLDIRDFTTISEQLSPKASFDYLNRYLRGVIPCVRQNGGFVDKYVGDAIMAIFPGGPEEAVRAAVELLRASAAYSRSEEERGAQAVRVGIGIHTGLLTLGTIGDEERMDVTVISDAVNLASRLEGLTKVYGAPIVLSEQTLAGLRDASAFRARFLGHTRVKGRREAVRVFELYDADPSDLAEMKGATRAAFEAAVTQYLAGSLAPAAAAFERVLAASPHDAVARLYLERASRELAGAPPASD